VRIIESMCFTGEGVSPVASACGAVARPCVTTMNLYGYARLRQLAVAFAALASADAYVIAVCCTAVEPWSREAMVVCGSTSAGVTTILRGTSSDNTGCLWQHAVGPMGNLAAPFHCAAKGTMSWLVGSPLDTVDIIDKGFDPATGLPEHRDAISFNHEAVVLKPNVGLIKVHIAHACWRCALVVP
jgi:hypothetical protein